MSFVHFNSGIPEFSVQNGCTACTKSYHFALAIARALSFQNVMIPRVTSYLGLDHVPSY
jgi:hypothetical protein